MAKWHLEVLRMQPRDLDLFIGLPIFKLGLEININKTTILTKSRENQIENTAYDVLKKKFLNLS